ncbi:hypothetical protein [Caldicellulosiruptor naganoensis]|uniref:Uncharacterized protein n=1 Tax=Caldicellulosiruptor naganoensis TaxID=29324 RepID=A0ABY7BKS1_9FIRM|nr:hypothetical protein [Caldicellulosiruptor naganoensis]WAM31974.1 hypothetical protein OTJ99_000461 [Caldicellulosiruptor naganoensis]
MNKTIVKLFTILAFLLVPMYIIWAIVDNTQQSKKTNSFNNQRQYYITSAGKENTKKGNQVNSVYSSVYSTTYLEKVSDAIYIVSSKNSDVLSSQKVYYKNKVLPSEMKYYNPVIKFIKQQILESNLFEAGVYNIYIEKIDLSSKYINAAVMFYPLREIAKAKNSSMIEGEMIVLTLYVDRSKSPEDYSLLSIIKGDHSNDFFNVFLKSVYKFTVIKKGEV